MPRDRSVSSLVPCSETITDSRTNDIGSELESSTHLRFNNKGCQPAFRVGQTVGPLSVSDRSKCYLVLLKGGA